MILGFITDFVDNPRIVNDLVLVEAVRFVYICRLGLTIYVQVIHCSRLRLGCAHFSAATCQKKGYDVNNEIALEYGF